jgi:hypothetical protein
MAETQQIYTFSYKEVAEALVKQQGIHEGLWGVYIKFGISATNIGPGPQEIVPAAIVPVLEVGIQRFKEESNLTVDAGKVNPP